MKSKIIPIIIFVLFIFYPAFAQHTVQNKFNNQPVYVDEKGIMRWSDTEQEASFYGINYSVPFAHAYRAMNYTSQDHKKAMDKDVYHFARLGFNAYRIHIWDKEISDKAGNLIKNDHLDYFDYLIGKLKERGIKIILTVMRMKDNGHPEADKWYGGFSDYWHKCEGHIDPEAIAAQVNFTRQFITHVNPYTDVSFLEDPDVIAFEIDNEPCHPGTAEQLQHYITTLLGAYRDAGNRKPVFYNVTHNLQHVESYYLSDIDGTTYQWYPTGLVAGFERKGNFLPHADEYYIPFRNVKNFEKKAKIVYEFDAPDFGGSYLYPAIARAFRSAGMQWITMFSYDAMDLAWANSEYVTHYLNLAYTPNKAIGMKIAGEVTHSVPLNKQYIAYPTDTIFESFRISYKENLCEMNTPEKFFHSNSTQTRPINTLTLKEIAGCGSSPVVKYEGTGAYFIDRLEDGVWRLEVMPDVLWTKDPFEKPTLRREVAAIMWNSWPIEIDLPLLGPEFNYKGLNKDNNKLGTAFGKSFHVEPGVYLLTRSGVPPQCNWNSESRWGAIRLGEFAAPENTNNYHVVHEAPKSVIENTPVTIKTNIVGPALPDSVSVYTGWRHHRIILNPNTPRTLMRHDKGITYVGTIPASQVENGILFYTIVVHKNGHSQSFPANVDANPMDWDYYWHEYWKTPIVPSNSPISLLAIDENLNNDLEIIPIPYDSDNKERGILKLAANISPLETPRVKIVLEEKNGQDVRFYTRKFIKQDIDPRRDQLVKITNICFLLAKPENIDNLDIGFVTDMGFTYTVSINVSDNKTVYKIPVSSLTQTHTALLPETYPIFMKRYFDPEINIPFCIQDIEFLEISVGELNRSKVSFELGAVWLE